MLIKAPIKDVFDTMTLAYNTAGNIKDSILAHIKRPATAKDPAYINDIG